MSFILDALRKSELERQRQSGPSMAEFPIAREDRRLPVALIAIGVLLAINVAVVVYFMLRGGPAPADPQEPAIVAAAPPPVAPRSAPQAIPEAAGPSALELEMSPPMEPPAVYYDSAATEAPDAPDPTLLPETPVPQSGVTYGEAPSADDAASVVAATGLPELSVDLHIFSDDPSKRAVFINGRRYAQGARIAEGPTVEQITRDGALLSYRGRRFLLPRL
jgi:general secretion pathway protein B